jgi:pimeloyl-ACP methyl ester carboxylesterase
MIVHHRPFQAKVAPATRRVASDPPPPYLSLFAQRAPGAILYPIAGLTMSNSRQDVEPSAVSIGRLRLKGLLGVPEESAALVIFAHGSGSGRLSPRNQYVAEGLRKAGLATLLLDLLTPDEELDRANVFDIPLLAQRLAVATEWAESIAPIATLPVGYFGASTGAAAALVAAAKADGRVKAIVSRGGRPDLAGPELEHVRAPTLLIVGSRDVPVVEMNEEALARLRCVKRLVTVSGATHLFEEPGALDEVIRLAADWFVGHLSPGRSLDRSNAFAP